jgi:hypothetical protein
MTTIALRKRTLVLLYATVVFLYTWGVLSRPDQAGSPALDDS